MLSSGYMPLRWFSIYFSSCQLRVSLPLLMLPHAAAYDYADVERHAADV